jgi:major membrane immunogen (membrane-anchored lipoprotein)
MKPLKIFLVFILFMLPIVSYTFSNCQKKDSTLMDTTYMDGTFKGESQANFTSEPYWGHVQITMKDNLFTEVDFTVRDTIKHQPVDSMYGIHYFFGNSLYMQQCASNGHGILEYPKLLMQMQNLDKVDAISGATWSYLIFKATAKEALKAAMKPAK